MVVLPAISMPLPFWPQCWLVQSISCSGCELLQCGLIQCQSQADVAAREEPTWTMGGELHIPGNRSFVNRNTETCHGASEPAVQSGAGCWTVGHSLQQASSAGPKVSCLHCLMPAEKGDDLASAALLLGGFPHQHHPQGQSWVLLCSWDAERLHFIWARVFACPCQMLLVLQLFVVSVAVAHGSGRGCHRFFSFFSCPDPLRGSGSCSALALKADVCL